MKAAKAIKTLACLMAAVYTLAGCRRTPALRGQIANYLSEHCSDKMDCRVRIKDAMPFHWDRMFIIRGDTPQPVIDSILGFHAPDVNYKDQLDFVSGKQLVAQEVYMGGAPDDPGRISFGRCGAASYCIYDTLSATFNVLKTSDGRDTFYLLRPAQ